MKFIQGTGFTLCNNSVFSGTAMQTEYELRTLQSFSRGYGLVGYALGTLSSSVLHCSELTMHINHFALGWSLQLRPLKISWMTDF
jgi:hypothetical protein